MVGSDAILEIQLMQVRLIGYCVDGSLFLVYEFIENGNLGQHLRGLGEMVIYLGSVIEPATFPRIILI